MLLLPLTVFGESFQFFADTMSSVITKGRERTLLSGNAKIITGGTTILADTIEIYGEDYRFADCRGNVRVTDTEKGITLEAQEMVYDRKLEISKISGQAVMEDIKNEMIVKGSYLEHRNQEDITIIQVGVRILKKDLVCRSEFALYRREQESLELSGFPFVLWEGDEYQASRIQINLQTDEIKLFGDVTGTVSQEEETNGE